MSSCDVTTRRSDGTCRRHVYSVFTVVRYIVRSSLWLPLTVRNIHSTAVYKRAAVGTAWPLLGWPSNGQAVSGLLRKLMVSHIVKKFNLQNKRSLCSYDVLFETDCKRSVMSAESSPRTAVTAVRIPLLYSRKVTSQFRRDSWHHWQGVAVSWADSAVWQREGSGTRWSTNCVPA